MIVNPLKIQKMKNFVEYSKEVLTVVMNNLKLGVSGSSIADALVGEYGFDRKAALTLVVGTMMVLNK